MRRKVNVSNSKSNVPENTNPGSRDETKNWNRKFSILYVEDDAILREVTGHFLKMRALSVYLAENGKIGLELFTLHRPDVVITDINMPEMDGIELTQEIRKLCSLTPIIITSANYSECIEDSLNAIDLLWFIPKPFDMSMVFQTIEALFRDREFR